MYCQVGKKIERSLQSPYISAAFYHGKGIIIPQRQD